MALSTVSNSVRPLVIAIKDISCVTNSECVEEFVISQIRLSDSACSGEHICVFAVPQITRTSAICADVKRTS